jgi:CTP:molybdopterin cytidylyltransferase MocA
LESSGWTSIILAGQRPGENDFAASNGVPAKALIPVAGEPMLGRVARTLLESPSIARIVVLAQAPGDLLEGALEWMKAEPRITTARSGEGISRSILAVAGTEAAPWPVLITTADHPLLTPPIVEEFLAGIGEADVAGAVVERRVVEASYPETRRTWFKFSDGGFSGANLFALRGPKSHSALSLWAGIEKDRKKAMRLLTYFGPLLALRAATRTISLDAALRSAGAKTGLDIRAVRLGTAEAAIDVDKQADLLLVESIFRRLGEAV